MGCGNYNTARCAGDLPLPCYIQRVILQAHSLKQQQLQGNSEEETRRGMLPVKPFFASRCCLPLMWMRREAGREVLEVLELTPQALPEKSFLYSFDPHFLLQF